MVKIDEYTLILQLNPKNLYLFFSQGKDDTMDIVKMISARDWPVFDFLF